MAREPDEFISTSSKVADYVKNNARLLINAAVMVLVLFLIGLGWFYYTREREKDALNLYNQAKQLYQSSMRAPTDSQLRGEAYRSAIEKLEEVYRNYPTTASALTASLHLGDCYFHLGDYDRAVDYYSHFLDESGKGNYLRSFAYEGLGYCYEEKGDYQKAIDYFERSLKEGTSALDGLLCSNIARCYEALDDRTKALEYYQKAARGLSDSLFVTLARDKIARLTY